MEDVKVLYDEKTDTLELYFQKPPKKEILNKLKTEPHRFYWNPIKSCWYGNDTKERETFIDRVLSSFYNIQKTYENKKEKSEIKNCMADHYEMIGKDKIYEKSDILLLDFTGKRDLSCGGYFRDLFIYVSVDEKDYVRVIELENANKEEKTCMVYDLYFRDPKKEGVLKYLMDDCSLHTISELYQFIKEPSKHLDVTVDKNRYPANRVFSPFCEGRRFACLPKEWTKKEVTEALLSGQIYEGVTVYEISGDRNRDVSTNVKSGMRLNLPAFTKDFMASYDGTYTIRFGDINEREALLLLTDPNSSKVLHVDLSCDLKEAIKRDKERIKESQIKKEQKRKDVIPIKKEDLDLNKIYKIRYLIETKGQKEVKEKTGLIKGEEIFKRRNDYALCESITQIEEAQIQRDGFYQVSSMNHPIDFDLNDDRLIPTGNHEILVTGQALLEFTKEGPLSFIGEKPTFGNTYEEVKEGILAFIEGQMYWNIKEPKTDYKDSLLRLEKEHARLMSLQRKEKTQDIAPKQKDLDSLLSQIAKAESARKSKNDPVKKAPYLER